MNLVPWPTDDGRVRQWAWDYPHAVRADDGSRVITAVWERDRAGDVGTWIANIFQLSVETGLSVVAVSAALDAVLPEVFG